MAAVSKRRARQRKNPRHFPTMTEGLTQPDVFSGCAVKLCTLHQKVTFVEPKLRGRNLIWWSSLEQTVLLRRAHQFFPSWVLGSSQSLWDAQRQPRADQAGWDGHRRLRGNQTCATSFHWSKTPWLKDSWTLSCLNTFLHIQRISLGSCSHFAASILIPARGSWLTVRLQSYHCW